MNDLLYEKAIQTGMILLSVTPKEIVDFMRSKGFCDEINEKCGFGRIFIKFHHKDASIKNVVLTGDWYRGGMMLSYLN